MWVITTRGFFSIVQKPWDGNDTLTIRSRCHSDLAALKKKYELPRIERSDDSDYMYRINGVDRAALAGIVAAELLAIDYDNFKVAVKERQGEARARIYMSVWSALLRLQPRRRK